PPISLLSLHDALPILMGSDYYQTLEEIEGAKETHKPLTGIGEDCTINNAILDKNCLIGNNVVINGGTHIPDGDFETHTIKDGIVVIKKKAVIQIGRASCRERV